MSVKKVISTLENWDGYVLGRRTGNTTRLVDRAIQILFEGSTCLVRDHYKQGTHTDANRELLQKILRRLEVEHAFGKYRKYSVNQSNLSITLIEPELA